MTAVSLTLAPGCPALHHSSRSLSLVHAASALCRRLPPLLDPRTLVSAAIHCEYGTRKCGSSPEPPPPPPRNATSTDNNCSSSFNESKDSNEISEAECDQPRNYPEDVRAHTAKDGLHSDEMRKLIDRPEATTPIPQQAVHGRGGLTAYDTVAV
ncbi:uncharacterized protein LOC123879857 [Maniola jurtina]|uniref:uncharacterized protein LOC123879857 n=1 Tax=Maniola jurtina TaxID=191418 RepID=UPI001E688E53|nr:uncharacterized protein LOC123879857 [Maniola jurtina]